MTTIPPTHEPDLDALELARTSLTAYADLELERATASPARQREITAEQQASTEAARTAALVSIAESLDQLTRRGRGPIGLTFNAPGRTGQQPPAIPRPPAVPPASGGLIGGPEQPRA
jgi:hypothetical protein